MSQEINKEPIIGAIRIYFADDYFWALDIEALSKWLETQSLIISSDDLHEILRLYADEFELNEEDEGPAIVKRRKKETDGETLPDRMREDYKIPRDMDDDELEDELEDDLEDDNDIDSDDSLEDASMRPSRNAENGSRYAVAIAKKYLETTYAETIYELEKHLNSQKCLTDQTIGELLRDNRNIFEVFTDNGVACVRLVKMAHMFTKDTKTMAKSRITQTERLLVDYLAKHSGLQGGVALPELIIHLRSFRNAITDDIEDFLRGCKSSFECIESGGITYIKVLPGSKAQTIQPHIPYSRQRSSKEYLLRVVRECLVKHGLLTVAELEKMLTPHIPNPPMKFSEVVIRYRKEFKTMRVGNDTMVRLSTTDENTLMYIKVFLMEMGPSKLSSLADYLKREGFTPKVRMKDFLAGLSEFKFRDMQGNLGVQSTEIELARRARKYLRDKGTVRVSVLGDYLGKHSLPPRTKLTDFLEKFPEFTFSQAASDIFVSHQIYPPNIIPVDFIKKYLLVESKPAEVFALTAHLNWNGKYPEYKVIEIIKNHKEFTLTKSSNQWVVRFVDGYKRPVVEKIEHSTIENSEYAESKGNPNDDESIDFTSNRNVVLPPRKPVTSYSNQPFHSQIPPPTSTTSTSYSPTQFDSYEMTSTRSAGGTSYSPQTYPTNVHASALLTESVLSSSSANIRSAGTSGTMTSRTVPERVKRVEILEGTEHVYYEGSNIPGFSSSIELDNVKRNEHEGAGVGEERKGKHRMQNADDIYVESNKEESSPYTRKPQPFTYAQCQFNPHAHTFPTSTPTLWSSSLHHPAPLLSQEVLQSHFPSSCNYTQFSTYPEPTYLNYSVPCSTMLIGDSGSGMEHTQLVVLEGCVMGKPGMVKPEAITCPLVLRYDSSGLEFPCVSSFVGNQVKAGIDEMVGEEENVDSDEKEENEDDKIIEKRDNKDSEENGDDKIVEKRDNEDNEDNGDDKIVEKKENEENEENVEVRNDNEENEESKSDKEENKEQKKDNEDYDNDENIEDEAKKHEENVEEEAKEEDDNANEEMKSSEQDDKTDQGINETTALKKIIFVTPSSLKKMKKVYQDIQNCEVRPLIFLEEEITKDDVKAWMEANPDTAVAVECMELVEEFLYESGDSETFRFSEFALQLEAKDCSTSRVKQYIGNRIRRLKSFFEKPNDRHDAFSEAFQPGNVVIIDLSDYIIGAVLASVLFRIAVGIYTRLKFSEDDSNVEKMLVLEEAEKYLTPTSPLTPRIQQIQSRIHHYKTNMLISTSNPTLLPPLIFQQSHFFIFHYFSSPYWSEFLTTHLSLLGGNADRLSRNTQKLWSPRHAFVRGWIARAGESEQNGREVCIETIIEIRESQSDNTT
ncbi:4799_t:CDS:2 [Paraglomus brasilianum]|uniref:4799_t:CDS:1 n=1 Tax=Paraglomus brasilianum TaxID=144538 RepID=A0A9N9C534_9GLOM|nr:4799_t:CDS:2 [Paraglomus brasilianum]